MNHLTFYIDKIILQINDYDNNLKHFYLGEDSLWLDKNTRLGLINSINTWKNAGNEEYSFWNNDKCYSINCDALLSLLNSIEIYSIKCFNTTQYHKLNLNKLTLASDILNYNYKIGYPETLKFTEKGEIIPSL